MKKVVPFEATLIPASARKVFSGVIFSVYQWPQQIFDGTTTTFEMLKCPDTAIGICLVDNKIIVIKDDQPHRGVKQNFPGGRVSPGEDYIAAAKREVLEETGYTFAHWRLIYVRQPVAKIEWFVHVYIAWDVTGHTATHLDPGERIVVELKTFAEARELVGHTFGYLSNSRAIFNSVESIQELLQLPEFIGRLVDRD